MHSTDHVHLFSAYLTFSRCYFILVIMNCLQMYCSLDIRFLTFLTSVTVVGVIAIEVKILHDSKDIQSICMTGKTLSFLFSLHYFKWTFTDTAAV